MGKGTNQIATEQEAKKIGGGSITASSTKCTTKNFALSVGCSVSGTYESNQCTKYSDLSESVVSKKYTITQSANLQALGASTLIQSKEGNYTITGSQTCSVTEGVTVTPVPKKENYTCQSWTITYNNQSITKQGGQFIMPGYNVVIDAELEKTSGYLYVSTDNGCGAIVTEEYESGSTILNYTVEQNTTKRITIKHKSTVNVFCVPLTGNKFTVISDTTNNKETNKNQYTFQFNAEQNTDIGVYTESAKTDSTANGTEVSDFVFYSIANSSAERDCRFISNTSTPRNISQCSAEMSRVLFDEPKLEDNEFGDLYDPLLVPPQQIGNCNSWGSANSVDMNQFIIDISFKIKVLTKEELVIYIKPFYGENNFNPLQIDDNGITYNIVVGKSGLVKKDASNFTGGVYNNAQLFYVSDPLTQTVLCRFFMEPTTSGITMSTSDCIITSLQFVLDNGDSRGVWIDFNYVQENFVDDVHTFLPEYTHFCSPDDTKITEASLSKPSSFTAIELSDDLLYTGELSSAYTGFTHGGHTNVDGFMYNYPIVGSNYGTLGQWHIKFDNTTLNIAKRAGGLIILTELVESPFYGTSIKDFELINNGTMEFFNEKLVDNAPAFPNISQYFSIKDGTALNGIYGMVLPVNMLDTLCDCLPNMFSQDKNNEKYTTLTIDFENACKHNYLSIDDVNKMADMLVEHPMLLSITFYHQTTYFISDCADQFFTDKDRMHPLYYLGDQSATSYYTEYNDGRHVLVNSLN